jgi:hypothetical protein
MKRSPLLHLAQQVFDSPLAIIPEKLDTILRAVGPRLAVDQAALRSTAPAEKQTMADNRKYQGPAFTVRVP